IMGISKETTEEDRKEIMGINKVTMVGNLNKEIMGISKGTMEEGPKKKMLETSKETMVGGLNKKIEATSKGMKRRINRNIEVGDSF
ncbi:FMRFamide neuropeptide, partial [Bacillus cereus]|nr:FMRFamide neuropeptide [Bacillus cereus]